MAGDINVQPSGLLGFLGIKNGGQYPQSLAAQLLPVWDLALLYASANASVRNDSLAIAAIGAQAFVTVPNGEAWFVLNQAAASVTLGVGQTIQLALQFTDAASTATIGLTDPSQSQTVGARALVSLRDPYFAPPGTQIGIICTQLAAGPVTVNHTMRFARFQV